MAALERFELECFEMPCDVLAVWDDTVRKNAVDHPVVTLRIKQGTDEPSIACLDAERARTLFNWLGVWLHTR